MSTAPLSEELNLLLSFNVLCLVGEETAERKETSESPKMWIEHKMHSMAKGQERNEAGEEHKKHEMGQRQSKPLKHYR